MTIPDFVDISAGHSVPHDVEQHAIIGFRETLGTAFVDADFARLYQEARHRNPDILTLGYPFLTGPLRAATIDQQIAYWANAHKCDIGALDWERDVYKSGGVTHDMGMQPWSAVLRGLDLSREHGIDAGLYASRYLFTPVIVETLIARKTPLIWIAAFGVNNGPAPASVIPTWLVKRCQQADVILVHQFAGATVDRDRVLVGTLQQFHALAGHGGTNVPGPAPSSGDPMTNLAPLTAHRVVDIAAGGVLFKTPGGDRFTTLPADITLGFLGSTPTHYHVADGDAGVYLARDDPKFKAIRTADQNVGA